MLSLVTTCGLALFWVTLDIIVLMSLLFTVKMECDDVSTAATTPTPVSAPESSQLTTPAQQTLVPTTNVATTPGNQLQPVAMETTPSVVADPEQENSMDSNKTIEFDPDEENAVKADAPSDVATDAASADDVTTASDTARSFPLGDSVQAEPAAEVVTSPIVDESAAKLAASACAEIADVKPQCAPVVGPPAAAADVATAAAAAAAPPEGAQVAAVGDTAARADEEAVDVKLPAPSLPSAAASDQAVETPAVEASAEDSQAAAPSTDAVATSDVKPESSSEGQ